MSKPILQFTPKTKPILQLTLKNKPTLQLTPSNNKVLNPQYIIPNRMAKSNALSNIKTT